MTKTPPTKNADTAAANSNDSTPIFAQTIGPFGVSVAMYQPDMPQNVGAMMRLCACLDVPLHIIEPCGFIWKEKEFRRTGMDYTGLVDCRRHISWTEFMTNIGGVAGQRLVLLTTKASESLSGFTFRHGDILLVGRESAGVPDEIHTAIPNRIRIPMKAGARSLNVVNAAAIILGEGLRQTKAFPVS